MAVAEEACRTAVGVAEDSFVEERSLVERDILVESHRAVFEAEHRILAVVGHTVAGNLAEVAHRIRPVEGNSLLVDWVGIPDHMGQGLPAVAGANFDMAVGRPFELFHGDGDGIYVNKSGELVFV